MRRFFIMILAFTALFLFPYAAYNYKYDYSGILKNDFSPTELHVEPNQHIMKMRFLTANPNKYNAYCFGNSRVGKIDLTHINNDLRYYNMTYSEGLPAEWLSDLKILVKNGAKIKQILIGIDEGTISTDPKSHENQFLRMPYREHEDWLTDLKYLLNMPAPVITPEIFERDKGFFDIYGTGRPSAPWIDEWIEQHPAEHAADPKFNAPYIASGTGRVAETIDELAKLKQFADENGIETIFFINPLHHVTYRNINLNDFNELKRRLALISGYYDFSGINSVTTNNYYYYETSHFRPVVGDMMLKRIFETKKDAKTDFGVWVTKDNIENHLQNLQK